MNKSNINFNYIAQAMTSDDYIAANKFTSSTKSTIFLTDKNVRIKHYAGNTGPWAYYGRWRNYDGYNISFNVEQKIGNSTVSYTPMSAGSFNSAAITHKYESGIYIAITQEPNTKNNTTGAAMLVYWDKDTESTYSIANGNVELDGTPVFTRGDQEIYGAKKFYGETHFLNAEYILTLQDNCNGVATGIKSPRIASEQLISGQIIAPSSGRSEFGYEANKIKFSYITGTSNGHPTIAPLLTLDSNGLTFPSRFSNAHPYLGYATDQSDDTIVWSLAGTNYQDGLAIGGTSKKLLWKGVEVATVNSLKSYGLLLKNNSLDLVEGSTNHSVATQPLQIGNGLEFIDGVLSVSNPLLENYLPTTGGVMAGSSTDATNVTKPTDGSIILYNTASGNSPYIAFQRGSSGDGYYDWFIQNRGGKLYFDVNGSNLGANGGAGTLNGFVLLNVSSGERSLSVTKGVDSSGNATGYGTIKANLDWDFVTNVPMVTSEEAQLATTSYVDAQVAGVDVSDQLKDYVLTTTFNSTVDDLEKQIDAAAGTTYTLSSVGPATIQIKNNKNDEIQSATLSTVSVDSTNIATKADVAAAAGTTYKLGFNKQTNELSLFDLKANTATSAVNLADGQLATQTYVSEEIAKVVGAAPEALDTLYEIATELQTHEGAYEALLGKVNINENDIGTIQTTLANTLPITFGTGLTFSGSKLLLTPATTTTLGGVKVGSGLLIGDDGTISLDGEGTLSNYLPLAGGEMQGPVRWNSNSLPAFDGTPMYLVGIDAFANGGEMRWQRVSNITVGNATTAAKLSNTTAIGSISQPVYFTSGGVPATCTVIGTDNTDLATQTWVDNKLDTLDLSTNEQLAAVAKRVDAAETAIKNNTNSIDANATKINTNTTTITNLTKTVNNKADTATVNTLSTNVSTLSTKVNTNVTNISNLTTRVGTAESNIVNAQNNIATINNTLSSTVALPTGSDGLFLKWTNANGFEWAEADKLVAATSNTLGGIKIGYTTNSTNRNYAVLLDTNDKAYVNVPWENTIYTFNKSGTGNALTGFSQNGNTITFATANKANTTTQTATVLGTSKTTEKIGDYQLVFSKGGIFSGTAANAGLVTRGVCGVTTPDANGTCSKENLYINYDSDNTYRDNRQLVLQAGSVGTHYGKNLYQYAAARGDAVKGWVEAQYYAGSSSNKGAATSAEKLTTTNVGSVSEPVYFVNGVPIVCETIDASDANIGSGGNFSYNATTKTLTIS